MIVDLFAGGGGMTESDRQEAITRAQQRLGLRPAKPRSAEDYLRIARWWRLEAKRGYPSSAKSLEYAANMTWAAERGRLTGPGTIAELRARAR